MKNLYLLLVVAPFLFGASCKKENLNDLPPATTSGKNIIGGYMDGKLFVSRREDLLSIDPSVYYNPSIPELYLSGRTILVPDGPIVGFKLKENLNQGKLMLLPGGKNIGHLILRVPSTALVDYTSESGYLEVYSF